MNFNKPQFFKSIGIKNKAFFLGIFFLIYFLVPSKVMAAICNDQIDGDWNSAATWSCGVVPGAGDDVTIDSHTVTITANQSALGVSISGGILNMGSYTLTNHGNWTYISGTVNSGTSTLIMYKQTATLTSGSVEYYNLTLDNGNTRTVTISGNAVILNNLALSTAGNNFSVNGDALEVRGNFYHSGTFGISGTSQIQLKGSGEQYLYPNADSSKTIGLNFLIDKSGGNLHLHDTLHLANKWIWLNGSLVAGTSKLKFNNGYDFNPGNVEYYDVEARPVNSGGSNVSLLGDLRVKNLLKVDAHYSNGMVTNNYAITAKDIEVTANGKITAGSSIIKVFGNFTNNGTFTAGTSTVALQGSNQTISGNTTFYRLYKLTNNADTLTITAGNTITIASGGVARFWGKPEGGSLSIRSSIFESPYSIVRTGSVEMEYVDIQDANFSAAVTATASNDAGGNTNLSIVKEFISTIRATGGDYATLSAWEAANQTNLTLSTTKVFSHGGLNGSIADGSILTGAISGATGTVTHVTQNQALMHTIVGTFQSGEQVYETQNLNYIVIADAGHGAIATAHPYNDWADGLTDAVTVDGWVTNSTNFVNIYVPKSERHNGKFKNDDGGYTGFTLKSGMNLWDNFTVVEGLIFDFENTNKNITLGSWTSGGSPITFRNNILLNPQYRHLTAGDYMMAYIYNNIFVVNSGRSSSYQAMDFGPFNTSSLRYARNNTFYATSSFAFADRASDVHNNIVWTNAATPITGATRSDYNIFNNSAGTGLNDINNALLADIDFSSTVSGFEDFHIQKSSNAIGRGTDFSTDSVKPFIEDIDGQSRLGAAWDIGADQSLKEIFYSVGQSAADLKTGTPTVTIASGTATFSEAQTGNIGVGDRITYNISSVAYIARKISQTQWNVVTAIGTVPTNVTTQTVNSITREYTSLAAAVAGATDTSHLSGTDLTSGNRQLNFPLYYDSGPDTTAAVINGYTTAADNYIKIYTPNDTTTEVNQSQRHQGKWDDAKYRLAPPSDTAVNIYEDFVRIEGLQMVVADNKTGIYSGYGNTGSIVDIRVSANIIKSDGASAFPRYGIALDLLGGTTTTSRVWNNLIYDLGKNFSSQGMYLTNGISIAYNNTIINVYTGIWNAGGATHLYNNIAQDVTNGYEGVAYSDYNISDLPGDASGSNSKNSAIVQFLDATNKDFHLHPDDTIARENGNNLSMDSNFAFSSDIDGQTRKALWDIGADQGATRIYRSVGPSKTAALASGASNSLIISGVTALFAEAVSNNVGVGDVIQYDSDNNGSIDSLAFILKRISSSEFLISKVDGNLPMSTTAQDLDWAIYRAHTSLANAEAGIENTGINATYRNFDNWTAGGDATTDDVGRDLVASNEQWNIVTYADGVDGPAVIDGWNTGVGNFIKLYSPESSSEVGAVQRHLGVWDNGKYRIASTTNNLIAVHEDFVRIEGLQLDLSGNMNTRSGIIAYSPAINDGAQLHFNNLIIRANGAGVGQNGIYLHDQSIYTTKAWNNLIYGFSNSGNAFRSDSSGDVYFYNNTIHNSATGVYRYQGQFYAKNNITQGCTDGFNGSFAVQSSNNISDLALDAPGPNSKNETIVLFPNKESFNFRLSPSDTAAVKAGIDLSADANIPFDTDIKSQLRQNGKWDIGADQTTPNPVEIKRELKLNSNLKIKQ